MSERGFDGEAVRSFLRARFEPTVLQPGRSRRQAVQAALAQAYDTLGLNAPSYIVLVPSPLAGGYAVGLIPLFQLDVLGVLRSSVDAGVESAVPITIRTGILRQLASQRREHPVAFEVDREVTREDARLGRLYGIVERLVGTDREGELWGAVHDDRFVEWRAGVLDRLSSDLPDDWYYYRDLCGAETVAVGWLARMFCDAGVEAMDEFRPLMALARWADHFWIRADYIVISDPPVEVIYHPDRGGSARWSDGWTVQVGPGGV